MPNGKAESRTQPDSLDLALREWRELRDEPAGLSGAARQRILRGIREPEEARARFLRPAPLFLPWRRIAASVALPGLVLVAAMGYLLNLGGPARDSGAPMLMASRVGDEVVFVIANGGKPHRVRKSSDPGKAAAGEKVEVSAGVFRDRLDSGSNLVFYRID